MTGDIVKMEKHPVRTKQMFFVLLVVCAVREDERMSEKSYNA